MRSMTIDLNRNALHIFSGNGNADIPTGPHIAESIGSRDHGEIVIDANGEFDWDAWVNEAEDNERASSRLRWCLGNCKGPWLLTAEPDERDELFEFFAIFLHADDHRRFRIWASLTS